MWLEIIKMAFESLLAKKTRSFLSMLGIIIGVSTVIVVFAIGTGAQKAVSDQFQNLSANSVLVMSMRGGGREGPVSSSKLATEDAKVILEKAQYVSAATGAITGNLAASYGTVSENYSVIGTDENYSAISNLKLSSGRFMTKADIDNKATVAILGSTVAEKLYGAGVDAVDTSVTLGGKKFTVIGVLTEIGSRLGPMSVDESVIVPSSTAGKNLLGNRGTVMINTQADSIDNVEAATAEITSILREEHKLKASQEDDFRVMDAGSMVSSAQETAQMLKFLLMAIAAITLLVSGIGIMNVMFVTVAERTKEIGIAKAIGGKRSDILGQFLAESVALSMVGGIIGVILGQITIPLISRINIITLASSLTGPLIGFFFSVFVGVFFGLYPAYKASLLDPVDALRSE